MTRMTIKVFNNGKQIAAFASELLARRFAIRFTLLYPWTLELHHRSGIVGQYTRGNSSPEFELHHKTCFIGEAE